MSLSERDRQLIAHGLLCLILSSEDIIARGVLDTFELEHRRVIEDALALMERLDLHAYRDPS